MTDKDLVRKIQLLKEIKPRKDWVVLTKSQILADYERPIQSIWELFPRITFKSKPVYATLFGLIVLIGVFGFAQNSLPGDFIYPLKKVTERSHAFFISESELPSYNLEIANKRLQELNKIAQTNQVKKLAPALEEYQASKVEIKREVSNLIENQPQKAVKIVKKIAPELQTIHKKEEKVLTSLGIESEADTPIEKTIVEFLIQDLKEQTLGENEEKILAEAEADFEAGLYSQALEKVLLMSNH